VGLGHLAMSVLLHILVDTITCKNYLISKCFCMKAANMNILDKFVYGIDGFKDYLTQRLEDYCSFVQKVVPILCK
jgi:hypothetical protein